MNLFKSMVVLGALGILTACSTPAVHVDYDAHASFVQYKTYDWQLAPKSQAPRPIMDARIKRAVDRELAAKAFRKETAADPDVLVSAYTVYGVRRSRSGFTIGVGGGLMRGVGVGLGTTVGGHRGLEGSIVLEVEDFKTRQMIWKGVSPGVLDDEATPEDIEEDVTKAVTELLKKFPPPVKAAL
jgi:hypothetical protein